MGFVRKSVSITDAQDAFLKKHNLSLSRMIQERIAKEIDDWRFAQATREAIRKMDRGEYEEMDMDEFLHEARKW